MHFEKNDPLAYDIASALKQLEIRNIDFEDLQQEVSDDCIKNAAIGLRQQKLNPSNVRGYLTASDALYTLGFDSDSLDMLYRYPSMHILKFKRLFNRYCNMGAYHIVHNLLENNTEMLAQIIVDDKKFANRISTLLQQIYDLELLSKYFPDHIYEVQKSENLTLAHMEKLYEEKKYKELLKFFYCYYWEMKNKTIEQDFFLRAVEPLPTLESNLFNRVKFFRFIAVEQYPNNIDFINKIVESLFASSEVGLAYAQLRKSITMSCYNEQTLHYYLRAAILKGVNLEAIYPFIMNDKNTSSDIKQCIEYHIQAKKFLSNKSFHERKGRINLLSLGSVIDKHPLGKSLQQIVNSNNQNDYSSIDPSIKVAFCISGQIRDLRLTADSFYKNFITPLNAKVFISTWDKQSMQGNMNRMHRLIGKDLTGTLPVGMWIPHEFLQKLPLTFKKLTHRIVERVSRDNLLSIFPSAIIQIDDETRFTENMEKNYSELKYRGNFNQAKMFYKNYQCYQLMDGYSKLTNESFDVVVRCRPDLDIKIPNIQELVENVYNNPSLIYVSYICDFGIGDQFAIGSRNAMYLYTQVWDKILEKRSFLYDQTLNPDSKQGREILLGAHLILAGIDIKFIHPFHNALVTPLAINITNIQKELEEDMSNLGFPKEWMPFYQAYNQGIKDGVYFK